MAVGDFNGDGKPDLAVANKGPATIALLLGYGNGTFANAVSYSTGSFYPQSVAVADFNGDGKTDLAVGYDTLSTTSVWGCCSATATAPSPPS